ncbi:unnamed protein product [Paramecium pentaurelia]|uniref:Uncharacterized protein n=1 Tax=Paramecium pentaurelia TaxID=43138 RepID=A0A8S1W455_9CILI|nr:unnamed protein product [Paramecium pentaurelia]
MYQRTILEDNENIQEDCKPKRYAASLEGQNFKKKQTNQASFQEWVGLIGIIVVTYLLIILVWALCFIGIDSNFKVTVGIFMVLFVLFVIGILIYWYYGLKSREELIRSMMLSKWQDSSYEINN